MNANDLFPPSEYLTSDDIEENGGEMQLTTKGIARKEYDEDDGTKKVRGVLSFVEVDKKLTLNVTNNKIMQAMFGAKDIDKTWIDKPVVLYIDPHVQYAGKEVKGIRIRLIDSKQDAVQAYWKKSRELGFTQKEGLSHLEQFGKDFSAALAALTGDGKSSF